VNIDPQVPPGDWRPAMSDGSTYFGDPSFGIVGDPDLEPLADEVAAKLRRVLAAL